MQDFVKKAKKYLHKKKKEENFLRNLLKNLFYILIGLGLVLVSVILIWFATLKIPDLASFEERLIVNSTKIYDRTGEVLLYNVHQDIKRTSIPFEEMGDNIKNATIAIEDSEFYNHKGVRISSTIRAVFSNIFGIGIGGGGSTITQQLVKNTLLTPERSIIRKIKEWVLAYKIENFLTKNEILELYLNEVPYGGTIYGIEEASKAYFNKKPIDLTIAESAYLAAIPQSPSVLSPFGRNLDRLEERKNLVLSRMLTVGYITQEQHDQAKKEQVVFEKQSPNNIKAPHFVFYIRDYLEKKYGKDVIETGGLKVITTLDWELQEKAEEYVKEGALKNEKDFNGKNASLVAIDPKTGQILSMVGSRDYFDKEIDGNFNVATALRQPGSSFKPFIYATAFNKGFLPETVLFDLPTEFQSTCNPYGRALPGYRQSDCYMPQNYDGAFRGPMSLRDALAQSINIPAIKLFYLAGLRDSLKTAEDMGISSLGDINRYGLTLVIGGGEVSLLDITSAYGVFANSGIKNNHTGILEIFDFKGNSLEKFEEKPKEVLPKNTALTVSNVLSDNQARIPTFGANSPLVVPGREVAVKTGTTNNNKDAWIVGYSPSLVVGVWAGNNDNQPMRKGGSALAGPIWNKFMNFALSKKPAESFELPINEINISTKPILRGVWYGNESYIIDKITGKLATENTPEEAKEEKVITNVKSILYWIDRNNILGPKPENIENNRQYINWNTPIQDWWAKNYQNYTNTTINDIPTEYENIHGLNKPKATIVEPVNNIRYNLETPINLKIIPDQGNLYPINKIDIFINGSFVNSLNNSFEYKIQNDDILNKKEVNELKIKIQDSIYNTNEIITYFNLNLN